MLLVFGRNRMVVVTGLLLLLIVVAIILSSTHAVRPAGGASYSGIVNVESSGGRTAQRLPITFSVNATATRVQDFRFSTGLPRACDSLEGVTSLTGVGLAPASAPIISPERFVARVPITESSGRVGTATIVGNFETLGRVAGALTTTFSGSGLSGCGVDATYTARS